MKAVILAAGRGSRMGSLTEDAPKCLVRLAGRDLLEWQERALRGGGVERVGVVCGYKGHLLEGRGLDVFVNSAWAETNMVASLTCAEPWLSDDDLVVSYSDIFYPAAAVAAVVAAPGDIVIAYDPDWLSLWSQRFADPLSDAETFRLDDQGRVVEIGRRADSLDEIRGQYMGLLKFSPTGWRVVRAYLDRLDEAKRRKLDMTGMLSGLIADGQPVHAVAVGGPWGEVDSADDLALYERLIAEGRMVLRSLNG